MCLRKRNTYDALSVAAIRATVMTLLIPLIRTPWDGDWECPISL